MVIDITKAIRGEERLFIVSIFYCAIPGILLFAFSFSVPVSLYTHIATGFAISAWCFFCSIALWRCAFNTKYTFLGYIARLSVAPLILILVNVLSGAVGALLAILNHSAP